MHTVYVYAPSSLRGLEKVNCLGLFACLIPVRGCWKGTFGILHIAETHQQLDIPSYGDITPEMILIGSAQVHDDQVMLLSKVFEAHQDFKQALHPLERADEEFSIIA